MPKFSTTNFLKDSHELNDFFISEEKVLGKVLQFHNGPRGNCDGPFDSSGSTLKVGLRV